MPKRKPTNEEARKSPPSKKPKNPQITTASDSTISADHQKIQSLRSQGKTWREVAIYFPDHNAESIKKRYDSCQRTMLATFTPEDDENLRQFLEKYEKEKCQKAAKELGKSPAGVQKRIKELGIGKGIEGI